MNLAIRSWDRLANWLAPQEAHVHSTGLPNNETTPCDACKEVITPGHIRGFILIQAQGQEKGSQKNYHPNCLPKGYDFSTLTLLQDSARPLTNIILNFALFGTLTASAFCLKTDPRIIKAATAMLWGTYAYIAYTNLYELAFQKNRVYRFNPLVDYADRNSIQNALKIALLLTASVALARFAIYNFNRMPSISLERILLIPPSILGSAGCYRIAQKIFYSSFLPNESLRHKLD